MKNFFSNGKLSGKSTAAIICFCLAAVAALGIFSYNKASQELTKGISDMIGTNTETASVTEEVFEPAENANAIAENVPMFPEFDAEPADETVILDNDPFGIPEETHEAAIASQDFTGAAVRPVNGGILEDYSDGELVKSKTLSVWKTHDGIDIAAEQGASVRSAADGTVISVSTDPLMGVTVIIDHGSGYEGYYCNLDYDVDVTEGQQVNSGTVIGEVGSTAEAEISEESHLHFGVKKNGSWIDPADMISGEGS